MTPDAAVLAPVVAIRHPLPALIERWLARIVGAVAALAMLARVASSKNAPETPRVVAAKYSLVL